MVSTKGHRYDQVCPSSNKLGYGMESFKVVLMADEAEDALLLCLLLHLLKLKLVSCHF